MIPSSSLQKLTSALEPFAHPGVLTPTEGLHVVMAITELMAENRIDADTMKLASRFLTDQDYREIVNERNVVHLCGYPLCGNDPKGLQTAHQINYRPTSARVPPQLSYRSSYCIRAHYQASEFYASQLSDAAIFARPDIASRAYGQLEYELQTVLLEEVLHRAQTENTSVEQVIQEFKSLRVAGSNSPRPNDPYLVELANDVKDMHLDDLKLQERDPTIPYLDASDEPISKENDDGHDMTGAVDGYIPRYKF